nr:DsrE/DsrF/DrsH-like family protein [Methanosarcina horonobensis]
MGNKDPEVKTGKGVEMEEKAVIILHSGDMDKVYSALIIANGALAMGMEASIYFTFWGLMRLKKRRARKRTAF